MDRINTQRPRHWKPLAATILVACLAVVAPAFGAFGPLASFGPAGAGPGAIGEDPPAVAVATSGRVYVADAADGRVEAFANDGTPDGGWGGLHAPAGVAAAPDGTVVVADHDGVYRYDAAGNRVATLAMAGGSVGSPAGVAVGADGTVYVADAPRGQVVALGGRVYGPLQHPVAVAIGADGTVYAADRGDERIHAFAADGSALRSWRVEDVAGVAVASDGSVLVTETDHDHLLRFAAAGDSLGEVGRLDEPRGVAVDCRDRAYVVDDAALRVHVFGEPGPPPPCVTPPPPPPPPAAAPAPEPDPVIGKTTRATLVSGTVLVGSGDRLHELRNRELLPIGSTIDATDGHVKVEFETAPGPDRQTYGQFEFAEFYDGGFTPQQTTTSSLVDINLLDDGVASLRAKGSGDSGGGDSGSGKKKSPSLWGKAHGRFRTRGRNGAATVRGTQWLTSERTNGTLFRVVEGVVQVREFASGRLVTLHAGEEFLARPACASRRSFQIRLRLDPTQVRSVLVLVRGKRVKVRRGSRLTAPIDLRGAPAGPVKVKIRVRTFDGRVLTGTRTYRTCENAVRVPQNPPEL